MIKMNICILDYGSGNIKSVYNLLKHMNHPATISNQKEDIIKSTHLILPGVGSFKSSMNKIKSMIPIKTLEEEVLINKKHSLGFV